MNITTINFNGRIPDEGEYKNLESILLLKKPILKIEKDKYIKDGILFIVISIFCLVMSIGSIWLTNNFEDRGIAYLIVSGTAFCAPIVCLMTLGISISSFVNIIKNPYKKTPKDLMKKFVESVIIGDDNNEFNKRSTDYAYSILSRFTPDSQMVEHKVFETYLSELRSEIKDILLADYKSKYKIKGNEQEIENFGSKSVGETILSETQISEKIMLFSYQYYLVHDFAGNKYSGIKMILNLVVVLSDDSWFLYDIMPNYVKVNDEQTLSQ